MKNMIIILALISAPLMASAEKPTECGQVQAAVWDKKLVVNIANFRNYVGKQQNFAVLNPLDFDWQAGSCICVTGLTDYDPESGSDYLYMQITVTKKISEDVTGQSCQPRRL